MSLINYSSKEVALKIVYYGPGLSGKTTNLQYLHANVPQENKGRLVSLATESDRTLFFDFMPMTLGKLGDFMMKFQLYTVPGQVRYDATRKLVLKGADAVVFVADSQEALREQNVESYQNMLDNLNGNNIDPAEIPIVLQYNKRDLKDIMSERDMDALLNADGHETINAEAVNGTGVDDTFRLVTQLLLFQFASKHKISLTNTSLSSSPPQQPQPASSLVAPPVPEKTAALETALEETPPDSEADSETPSDQIDEPPMPDKPEPKTIASEVVYDQSQFTKREMPSIDELPPVTQDPPEITGAVTEEIRKSLYEITIRLKESQVETCLEKLTYSSDAIKQTASEVVAELKESRKNQEQMIELLKKIESALMPKTKTTKRA